MSYSAEEAAATRALMQKILDVITTDGVGHSVAINALANLASNFARTNPCCTANAGLMFIELGGNLVFQAGQPALVPNAPPSSQALH